MLLISAKVKQMGMVKAKGIMGSAKSERKKKTGTVALGKYFINSSHHLQLAVF